jgi:DNA-binding NtrC family response regulator
MKRPIETSPIGSTKETCYVLSVSPLQEDHSSLQCIIHNTKSIVFEAHDLASARNLLRTYDIAVVFCERDLHQGWTWIDILEDIHTRPGKPSLIVTSRLADDRLWVEVLNRGAWDLLAKPYDNTEVIHCFRSAWRHWRKATQLPLLPMKVTKAAS